jgi:hypothetical protein
MEFATAFAIIVGLVWFIFFMRSEHRAELKDAERQKRIAVSEAREAERRKNLADEAERRKSGS